MPLWLQVAVPQMPLSHLPHESSSLISEALIGLATAVATFADDVIVAAATSLAMCIMGASVVCSASVCLLERFIKLFDSAACCVPDGD